MSISDAYVRVDCDGGCGQAMEIELTSIARSGWDERDLPKALERAGWLYRRDEGQFCEECRPGRPADD